MYIHTHVADAMHSYRNVIQEMKYSNEQARAKLERTDWDKIRESVEETLSSVPDFKVFRLHPLRTYDISDRYICSTLDEHGKVMHYFLSIANCTVEEISDDLKHDDYWDAELFLSGLWGEEVDLIEED